MGKGWRDQRKRQVQGPQGKKEPGTLYKKQRVKCLEMRFKQGMGKRQEGVENRTRS